MSRHRLRVEVYDFDQAKINLSQNLGFTLEGRCRQTPWAGNGWADSLYLGVLATEGRHPPFQESRL